MNFLKTATVTLAKTVRAKLSGCERRLRTLGTYVLVPEFAPPVVVQGLLSGSTHGLCRVQLLLPGCNCRRFVYGLPQPRSGEPVAMVLSAPECNYRHQLGRKGTLSQSQSRPSMQ